MDAYEIALAHFEAIKAGRDNAVKRPANRSADRMFRSMIAKARDEGQLIIARSDGGGYYIPDVTDDIEHFEARMFVNRQKARAVNMAKGTVRMSQTLQSLEEAIR